MDAGVERIVDQVVNPKIRSLVEPEVKRIINAYLGEENMDDEGKFTIPKRNAPHPYSNASQLLQRRKRPRPMERPRRATSSEKTKRCLRSCPTFPPRTLRWRRPRRTRRERKGARDRERLVR